MAYIPNDTEWYIAELVMECQVEGDPHNVVHVNIVLVRADSPEDAFQKAKQIGHDSEDTYLNTEAKTVKFIYRGLQDLNAIYDKLEHGAELMFEEKIGVSEERLQDILTPKPQLTVFQTSTRSELDKPNYASKEITEEVERRMRDTE